MSKKLLSSLLMSAARLAGTASVGVICAISAAQAGAFGLREQGAVPLGEAFAGVAAGSAGLASMYWNPATITDNAGWQSSGSITGIIPHASVTTLPGTSPLFGTGSVGNIAQSGIVPSSYQSYQFNDNLFFGLSINAPFGSATKAPPTFAGGFYGRTSKVFSTDISPTVGYKVNDWLSIGAGAQIEYFKTRLTSNNILAGGLTTLEGDSWGVGYTLGVTFKPLDGTEIGIGYRSQVKEKLEGQLSNFPSALLPAVMNVQSNFTLPDEVTLGLKQRVTDRLTLSTGFEWTHWSVLNSFPVTITSPAAVAGVSPLALGFRYRDGWLASIGGEYQVNEQLAVRAGLGYERSPVDDLNRGVRLPDSDRILASLGASYHVNRKLALDFGYQHIFAKNGNINITSVSNPAFNAAAPLPYVGRVSAQVDIISAGFTYRWDDPTVAITKGPLVRK